MDTVIKNQQAYLGKRICFLGASTIQNGGFIYCLRSFFQDEEHAPKFFNRGLGGNRSVCAPPLLEDEVYSISPEYCFICYGLNDLGIWLYDNDLSIDERLRAERHERDELYFQGLKETVELLLAHGIKPILCSPTAVNELLVEKEDVATVADNKEKGELITPSFYKRKTFENINTALFGYRDKISDYAKQWGIGFCDLFTFIYEQMRNKVGLYREDGIHFTKEGQAEIAKAFLVYLGVKDLPKCFKECKWAEKLANIEEEERKLQYVKWAMYNPFFGYDVLRLDEILQSAMQDETLTERRKNLVLNYIAKKDSVKLLRAEIEALTSKQG